MEYSDTKQLRLEAIFPPDKPLEVELGCGKAKFITHRAMENFGNNFIAIDRIWRFMKAGFLRAEKNNLTNIRFFKCDAKNFVSDVLPDHSVDIFHIYHPDPWPKSKQRKRRLIQADFLKLLAVKSKPAGRLFISTDHADYFRSIKCEIENCGIWDIVSESKNQRIFQDHLKTNYQLKYEKQGKDIYYLELRSADTFGK